MSPWCLTPCNVARTREVPARKKIWLTQGGRRDFAETRKLGADGGAEGVGQGLAETLDVGVVLGFDHDAGELLGAGVAEHDAAVFAERGLGFGEGAVDFRQRL